jgi:hypothetical protein
LTFCERRRVRSWWQEGVKDREATGGAGEWGGRISGAAG